MLIDHNTIAEAARRIEIAPEALAAILERGHAVSYQAGEYLFHESTPREWLGLVLEGQLELVRGQHGQSVHLGVLESGAIVSEGVLLDDSAHATSAVTRHGAKIWQISRSELHAAREANPGTYFRIVGQ